MDYSMANNIEKILTDVDKLVDSITKNNMYVGEIMSGEV
jgi:hypothetical protein